MLTVDVGDNILEIDDGAASTDILHGRIRPEPIDVNDCAVGQELTDGPPHMDLPEGKAYLVTNLRSNLFTDSLNHLATSLEIDMQEGGYPRLSGPPSQLTFYELTLWLSDFDSHTTHPFWMKPFLILIIARLARFL